MDKTPSQQPTHLFTVRMWLEDLGDGQTEWRGRVQHVVSGEIHYFRHWPVLIAWLKTMLAGSDSSNVDAPKGAPHADPMS
jgi:hypothetical protein